MSQALRKLVGKTAKNNCTIVFINQLREKVGVLYGNPETTAGGRALKFYASVRIDVRRKETNREAGEAVSNTTRVKIVKNKVAPPFREAEIQIVFGKGISRAYEVVTAAIEEGIIHKSGAWFSYDDTFKVQGKEAAEEIVAADEALFEELLSKVEEASAQRMTVTRVSVPEGGCDGEDDAEDFE